MCLLTAKMSLVHTLHFSRDDTFPAIGFVFEIVICTPRFSLFMINAGAGILTICFRFDNR